MRVVPVSIPSVAPSPLPSRKLGWLSGWAAIRTRTELVGLARVLLLVFFLRYLLMPFVGFVVKTTFPLDRPENFTVYAEPHVFWDMYARYDSGWYYTIAQEGYRYVPGEPSNLAFFPLYPLCMRALGGMFGGEQHHYYLAGMLVSHAAFLAALIVLFYLARLDLDEKAAQRAVLYIAVFPFSLFYARVYPESLFLLLSVSAFLLFRTRRWELGGLAGGLAALTRVNGILSIVALSCIAVQNRITTVRDGMRAAVGLGGVAAGLGVYCAFAYVISGSPLG